ncbi:MAG: IPT/TIG domain-containing protein, partial [Bdellovibrionota bacterium]
MLISLAGCSLQTRDHARLSLLVSPSHPNGKIAPDTGRLGRVTYAPATVDLFDCYAIVVTGSGIETKSYGTGACTDLGASSGLVAAPTGGEISLSVPSGAGRLIRLVGVKFPPGSGYQCSGFSDLADYLARSGAPGERGVLGVAESTQDVITDSTVELTNTYTGVESSKFALSCVSAIAPTITMIQPQYFPVAGGTTVTITGTEFDPAMTVSVDGLACTVPTVATLGTSATCVVPAHAAGPGTITVLNPDALSGSTTAQFYAPLALAVSNAQATVSKSVTLTASSGVAPYTFRMRSGSGTVSANGILTTSATATTDTVEVVDALGLTASASVQVYGSVAWTDHARTLLVGRSLALTPGGGLAQYSYSILSGSAAASIASTPTGALLTATSTSGQAVARVTDSLGTVADSSILVVQPLVAQTREGGKILEGATLSITVSGGAPPYSISLASGAGSVGVSATDASVVNYLASGTGLSSTMATSVPALATVRDAISNEQSVTISVQGHFRLSASSTQLAAGNSAALTSAGGMGGNSISILSGIGTLDTTTWYFTASSTPGDVVIRATDSDANTAHATLSVAAALAIAPTTVTLSMNKSITFAASAGVPPYSFSLLSGSGSINGTSGSFTSPTTAGTSVVRTVDVMGNYAPASVITVEGGTIDSRFGSMGSVTLTNPYTASISPAAMARHSTSGKIATASYFYHNGYMRLLLTQHTSEGVVDASFGNSGIVVTSL